MVILNIVGVLLIILSAVSGITLYINSINEKIKDTTSLIGLFCCSLIGGPFLHRMGAGTQSGFLYVSYILFSLGIVSAITLLLTELKLFDVKSKFTLWVFFVGGIFFGAMGIYAL